MLSILIPVTTLAWNDCPRNEIDCPAPGDCARYVDTDNDKICDRSQPAPEDRNIEITNTQAISDKGLIINDKRPTMTYHLLPISLLLIILYAITHILSIIRLLGYSMRMYNGEKNYYKHKPDNIPAQTHSFTAFQPSNYSLFDCNQ